MVEKYTLTSRDYEWLKSIIKNNESIETIYKKLYELELNGQKDSQEYKDYLDYLKIALEVENQIYESGKINLYRGEAIFNYIVTDRLPERTLKDKESLVAQDYDSRVLRRILGSLTKLMETDYKTLEQEMIPKKLIQFMEVIGVEDIDERVSSAVYSGVEIKKAIEHDIFNGFLVFLRDLLNNSKYEEYRPNLLATKYNAAFVDKDVEIDMLERSFELPDGFYSSVNFAGGICETPQELLDQIKNHQGVEESVHQLMELLKMHDGDYEDKNKQYGALLRQCFARSAFLLMDEEVLGDLNYHLHNFTEEDAYLKDYSSDNIGQQKVFDCFKKINEDKKRLEGGTQFGTV